MVRRPRNSTPCLWTLAGTFSKPLGSTRSARLPVRGHRMGPTGPRRFCSRPCPSINPRPPPGQITPWQGPQINALLEALFVSAGVSVGGGGYIFPGGKVPPSGPPDGLFNATLDATLGLFIHALMNRVGDRVGRDALRGAALEMTRRLVDRLIAQAKTPAPRPMPPQQGGGLRGRLGRTLARSPRAPEDAPKT